MLYTGVISASVGSFLAALRTCLLAQGWTSLGLIATNHEVFFSNGISGTETIYIGINDSVSGSVYFRAGTSYTVSPPTLNNPTTARYIQLHASYAMPYWFFVTKDRFVAVVKNFQTNPYALSYCGLLTRYDPTKLFHVFVTGATTASGVPVGVAHGNTFTGGLGQILHNILGTYNQTMNATALNANFGALQLPNPVDGKMIISPILIGLTVVAIYGELQDVFSLQNAEIANEDVLTKGADVYTCFVISTYKCCIKN
jgi:hypothetical protein